MCNLYKIIIILIFQIICNTFNLSTNYLIFILYFILDIGLGYVIILLNQTLYYECLFKHLKIITKILNNNVK